MTDTNKRMYYSPAQIAEMIPYKEDTIWKWCKSGKLPASRICGKWMITVDDLNQYLQDAKYTPTAEGK